MRIATKSSKLNISKLENTKKIADIFAKNIFKGDVILFFDINVNTSSTNWKIE